MRYLPLVLLVVAILVLVCPSSARYGQGGSNKRKNAAAFDLKLPTEADKNRLEGLATMHVLDEMGDNRDVDEFVRRRDALVKERMREAYPEVFNFKPRKKVQSTTVNARI